MKTRVVTLPNGRAVRLGMYVAAWRKLLTLPAERPVSGFDYFAQPAAEILRELRRGMHDRINRHDGVYGRGRKWDSDYQRALRHAASALNTPRLVIDWLPADLKPRFAHRLRCNLEV